MNGVETAEVAAAVERLWPGLAASIVALSGAG